MSTLPKTDNDPVAAATLAVNASKKRKTERSKRTEPVTSANVEVLVRGDRVARLRSLGVFSIVT